MSTNKNFTYWIIILPIIAIILTSSILTQQFISHAKEKFKEESINLERDYILKLKKRIKQRVNRAANLIETNIEISKEEEKNSVKNLVNIAFNTIQETYNRNKNKPYDEIIQEIRKQLEHLKFYNNGSGYFFIIDLNDKVLMQPQTPSHRNKILTDIQDKNGKYILKSFKNIIKTKGEGFDTWYWSKPKSNLIKEKIGYIKVFKPLNLYIGTAKYIEDINSKIQEESLKLINIMKYEKNEYIFAMNKKGTTLAHINKDFIGKKISSLSKLEKKIVNNILKKAENKNGSFIGYTPTSYNIDSTLSKKISYVKTIPSLQWIIGTGQYTTILQEQINKKTFELKIELRKAIDNIVFVSILISVILIILLAFTAKKIQFRLSDYETLINEKNIKLNELNENLENTVKEQVLKIRQKDDMIHQQSKLASMGEMLSNIAHQWRQPLSTISTAASGIKMQEEVGILNKKEMIYSLDAIVNNTQVLSQTINDFSDFFRKDKIKKVFKIEESIKKVLSLISPNLKNKNIKIIQNIESSKLYDLENELAQVLLNILSNAKDALDKKSLDEKFIFIDIKIENKKVNIQIKDNAGGIKTSIIDKIFEPYFTTKHKQQGTGIGLYMSQIIIVNHMNGELNVRNEEFVYKNKKYKGAVFEIILNKKS